MIICDCWWKYPSTGGISRAPEVCQKKENISAQSVSDDVSSIILAQHLNSNNEHSQVAIAGDLPPASGSWLVLSNMLVSLSTIETGWVVEWLRWGAYFYIFLGWIPITVSFSPSAMWGSLDFNKTSRLRLPSWALLRPNPLASSPNLYTPPDPNTMPNKTSDFL